MTEVGAEQGPQRTELKRLHALTERYKERLGSYDLIPVGDAGYIAASKRQLPMAGNDWFMFDYDDTFCGTTEVKEKRLDLYKNYARSLGVDSTDDDIERVMDTTDRFSRWEDTRGGGDQYHANAHMSALNWATGILKSANEGKINGEDAVSHIDKTLARIRLELNEDTEPNPNDPFHFRAKDRKLILRSLPPWSREIENIFDQTVINPPQYRETLDAAANIGRPNDSIHRLNLGVFTYGDPYYQLLKVFELLEQNPDLAISQIWLTKLPKGKFIEELVNTKATIKTEQQYVPSVLEEDSFEGISRGSGYPLGQHEHVIIMLDDSPKELNSIMSANSALEESTGASFVVVRSRRNGTKEGEKEWDVNTRYGEIDFRSGGMTTQQVITILEANRYLVHKSKLGPNNPAVRDMEQELKKQGVGKQGL